MDPTATPTIGGFTPTLLEPVIRVEQLITLHYFAYAPDFSFGGERHDFWEIAYADRGEVGVVAESEGYSLHQGEAIFHRPGEYHNIWAKDQYANVVILSFVCASPAMDFFQRKILRLSEDRRALLSAILAEGERCFTGPDAVEQTGLTLSPSLPFGGLQTIRNQLELLLIGLVRDNAGVARESRLSHTVKRQGEVHIVQAIQQYLRDNLYHPITYADVLREACFSKSYLSRLFREHTGSGVMEYLADLRMEEARRLIGRRELTFTQIAEKLCFSSIHYFSRVFKGKTGMTPSEYQRSVRSRSVL